MTHLENLANEIIHCLHSGGDRSQLLNTFNQLSVRQYSIRDFDAAFGSIGMKEFVKEALMPDPNRIVSSSAAFKSAPVKFAKL